MVIERSEVYFIVQQDLEEAVARREPARPMFTLVNPAASLPTAGDKIVYADVSYTVMSRTFSYEAGVVKIIIALEL